MNKLIPILLTAFTLSVMGQGTIRREIIPTSLFTRQAAILETAADWRTKLGITAEGGTGSVASVGISLPSIFSVSGSPVTESGTITALLNNQLANTIFAGPTSGGAATPTFRALTASDIPSIAASKTTSGIFDSARLGSGVANGTTFLRGDGLWSTVTASLDTNAVQIIGDNRYVTKPLSLNSTNFAILSATFDGFEDLNRMIDANSRTEQNTVSNYFTSGAASNSPLFAAVSFTSGILYLRDTRWMAYNSPTNVPLQWVTNWVNAWARATNASGLFYESVGATGAGVQNGNGSMDANYDVIWWVHYVLERDRAMGMALFDRYKVGISNALAMMTYSNHLDFITTSIGGWGYRDVLDDLQLNAMMSALHVEACQDMADILLARGENANAASYLNEIPLIVTNVIAHCFNNPLTSYSATNDMFIVSTHPGPADPRPDIIASSYFVNLGVLPPEIENRIIDRLIAGTPWGSRYAQYDQQIYTNGTVRLQGGFAPSQIYHQSGGGWPQFVGFVAKAISKKRPDISALMVAPLYTNTVSFGGISRPIHNWEYIAWDGSVTNSSGSPNSGSNNIGSFYGGAIRPMKLPQVKNGVYSGHFTGPVVSTNITTVTLTATGTATVGGLINTNIQANLATGADVGLYFGSGGDDALVFSDLFTLLHLDSNGNANIFAVSTNIFHFRGVATGNAGALTNAVQSKVANYTVLAADGYVLLAGNKSATMPDPTLPTVAGKTYYIQCTSSGTNAILPFASETFNGSGGLAMTKITNNAVGKSSALFSNGTNWWVLFNNN